MVVPKDLWENSVLAIDFKIGKGCNSGVFLRTHPLTPRPGKDVRFNGIEVALDDTKESGFHDTGALYDRVKPSKHAMESVGEWNRAVVTSDKTTIAIELNGETVTRLNASEWPKPNIRPDGAQVRRGLQGAPGRGRPRPAGPRLAVLVQAHQDQAAEVTTAESVSIPRSAPGIPAPTPFARALGLSDPGAHSQPERVDIARPFELQTVNDSNFPENFLAQKRSQPLRYRRRISCNS